jgi:hypothetical protein
VREFSKRVKIGQDTKGVRGMPWRQEAKKDAASSEMLRGIIIVFIELQDASLRLSMTASKIFFTYLVPCRHHKVSNKLIKEGPKRMINNTGKMKKTRGSSIVYVPISINYSTMAMIGIFAHADIGNHYHIRTAIFN